MDDVIQSSMTIVDHQVQGQIHKSLKGEGRCWLFEATCSSKLKMMWVRGVYK